MNRMVPNFVGNTKILKFWFFTLYRHKGGPLHQKKLKIFFHYTNKISYHSIRLDEISSKKYFFLFQIAKILPQGNKKHVLKLCHSWSILSLSLKCSILSLKNRKVVPIRTGLVTKLLIEYPPLDYYISWSTTLKKLNVKLLPKVTYVENKGSRRDLSSNLIWFKCSCRGSNHYTTEPLHHVLKRYFIKQLLFPPSRWNYSIYLTDFFRK